MHKKYFPLFILVVSILQYSPLLAQETILLQGKILNDSIEVEAIHVVNLSLKKGTITDANGIFHIAVRLNDTLHFSAVQFQQRDLIITAGHIARKRLSLYLEPEVTALETVEISDIDLSGNLESDAGLPDLIDPYDPAKDGIPVSNKPKLTQEERRLYTATGGAGPVGMLIGFITGQTKILKRNAEISRMEARVQRARAIFNTSIYIEQLNIPLIYIDDFAHFVYLDNEEALKIAGEDDEIMLLEYLIEMAPLYRKYKEWED